MPLTTISFVLDGNLTEIDFSQSKDLRPTTTVLQFLRSLPGHKGVKEGCAEGDCGACTVALAELNGDEGLSYRAVDSCLLLLPMLHRRQLITVENLKLPGGSLHPVQQAVVESYGTQCGFCTPGIVMSLFAAYKSGKKIDRMEAEKTLSGNLCRCTGYRSIIDAAVECCSQRNRDHFDDEEEDVIEMLRSISDDSLEIDAADQNYFLPNGLENALWILNSNPGATVIAGSTDISLRITKLHRHPVTILDISRVSELRSIIDNDGSVTIGAAVPVAEIIPLSKRYFPALESMLDRFASEQIRAVGTLGGNLGTASPVADAVTALMAYDARAVLESIEGKREFPLDQFIIGYRSTQRNPNELITAIIIHKQPHEMQSYSYKISKRHDMDISTVSGAGSLLLNKADETEKIILAFGGASDRVKRAARTEKYLLGKKWEKETIVAAQEILLSEFTPMTDVRGSAEVRKIILRNILMKFWLDTSARKNQSAAERRV